jgi:hypothetical protein
VLLEYRVLHVLATLIQNICELIARTVKKKTRKETNLTFYKIMAVPVLLYGSETWTPRKRDWNRILSSRD